MDKLQDEAVEKYIREINFVPEVTPEQRTEIAAQIRAFATHLRGE